MHKITAHIAKQLRDLISGGNWTGSNFRTHLDGVTREQAVSKNGSMNSIAALVFHCGYYVTAITSVLEHRPFNAKDKFSFDLPPIDTEEDWQQLLVKTRTDAEHLAALIEQFPDDRLFETFVDQKYGTYYRNFHGVIEHFHYHLGQIVLLKKMSGQQ
jgi:hypothetical protein